MPQHRMTICRSDNQTNTKAGEQGLTAGETARDLPLYKCDNTITEDEIFSMIVDLCCDHESYNEARLRFDRHCRSLSIYDDTIGLEDRKPYRISRTDAQLAMYGMKRDFIDYCRFNGCIPLTERRPLNEWIVQAKLDHFKSFF